MNVENGNRIVDQGDYTGALPGSPKRCGSIATTPMRRRRTAFAWEPS